MEIILTEMAFCYQYDEGDFSSLPFAWLLIWMLKPTVWNLHLLRLYTSLISFGREEDGRFTLFLYTANFLTATVNTALWKVTLFVTHRPLRGVLLLWIVMPGVANGASDCEQAVLKMEVRAVPLNSVKALLLWGHGKSKWQTWLHLALAADMWIFLH